MAATYVGGASANDVTTTTSSATLSALPALNLYMVTVFVYADSLTVPTVSFNGAPITPSRTQTVQNNLFSTLYITTHQMLFSPRQVAGATTLTVQANQPAGAYWSWASTEISGAQIVEQPFANPAGPRTGGNAAYPKTTAWTSLATGLLFVWMFTNKTTPVMVEPAGFTVSGSGSSLVGGQWQVVRRTITTVGAQVSQAWTTTSTPLFDDTWSWSTVQMPFYDLGLRIPDSTAIASGAAFGGVSTGSNEPANPVHPYEPPVNPLPPVPTEIVVPLPPWVPGTGPYRSP